MQLFFIALKTYLIPGMFVAGFLTGFILQLSRVRHYRDKQIRAEQEKLKMQAQMLGMGDMYEPDKPSK